MSSMSQSALGSFGRIMSGVTAKGKASEQREQIPVAEPESASKIPPALTASTFVPEDSSSMEPGAVFRDCDATCPEMVVVPAGSFMLGSPATEQDRANDEGPRRSITFARAFAMGKFEVTFAEWDACTQAGACPAVQDAGWGRGRRPVMVNWGNAHIYIAWLSKRTGKQYFLPSETEWEYAARAGTTTPWNTGNAILGDDANILNLYQRTVPVGGFAPNGFGLHDMHGNVWEWVKDCVEVGYFSTPQDGSAYMPETCSSRVIRGGGYDGEPAHARSANRGGNDPAQARAGLGFRVARAL